VGKCLRGVDGCGRTLRVRKGVIREVISDCIRERQTGVLANRPTRLPSEIGIFD
jgi:hypothetical protein